MRLTSCAMFVALSSILAGSLAACAVDTASDDPTTTDLTSDIRFNPATDGTEPVFVNGLQCRQIFPGSLTPQTQTYVIWPIGTNGIVNTTYNTSQRPNLYAVFGTSTPLSVSHHVDGADQFDHYHIAENNPHRTEVDNTKWDVLALFPGPNYHPETYVPAKSTDEMFAQSATGILTGVMTLTQAGFPELVLYTPIQCPGAP
jgi:hypothetical protein